MLKQMKSRLIRFTSSSYFNLAAAVVLFVTAGYEIITTLDEISVGAHHGIFVYSIFHILKTVPDFLDGTEDFKRAKSGL
jgi:hypothetical protein